MNLTQLAARAELGVANWNRGPAATFSVHRPWSAIVNQFRSNANLVHSKPISGCESAAMLEWVDKESVLFLNSFIGHDKLVDKIINGIGGNPLVRGFPVFFPLVALWFYDGYQERRGRILAGLFASCLAVFLSVWLQYHVHIHTRPFLDQTLPIKIFDPRMVENWDRLGSFPSDTATLYCSLITIIFLEWPIVGGIALLWSLVTVGVVRIAVGYHYPSDILGGLVLGPGCVYLIAKNRYIVMFFDRLLNLFKTKEYLVNGLFFIFLAEAYDLFSGLQSIVKGLMMVGERLMSR
jgi:membrane-associated phospholipid phosphatase